MAKELQTVERAEVIQSILTVHVAEYNAMRGELLEMEKSQSQLMLYALVSVGAAVPILSGFIQNQFWTSLLIASMIFSSVAWVYLGYLGTMFRIAVYIETHLRPAMDTLIRQAPSSSGLEFEILPWEHFAREKRLNILTWPKAFEILVLILPSVGCIMLYLANQPMIGAGHGLYDWLLIIVDSVLTVGAIAAGILINEVSLRMLRADR